MRPRVIGSFVAGYGITSVTADPAVITIEGPQNRVGAIDVAITDPVDATGVVGTGHIYHPRLCARSAGADSASGADSRNRKHRKTIRGSRPALSASLSQNFKRELFGTDGIRGVAGEYPLDRTTVYAIGRALGQRLAERDKER